MDKRLIITKNFIKRVQDLRQDPPVEKLDDFSRIVSGCNLGYLDLNIKIPKEMIDEEIKRIEHLFVPHRDAYGESCGWQSFCIHGKSYDATREDSYYNDDRLHNWTTEALELMPNTVSFFKDVWPHDSYQRLRVMKLEPRGYITLHNDGGKDALNAINIAITNPQDCNFYMDGIGILPFSPGTALMINVHKLHAVINNSEEPRYHIIVHQDHTNTIFQNLVIDSYNAMIGS